VIACPLHTAHDSGCAHCAQAFDLLGAVGKQKAQFAPIEVTKCAATARLHQKGAAGTHKWAINGKFQYSGYSINRTYVCDACKSDLDSGKAACDVVAWLVTQRDEHMKHANSTPSKSAPSSTSVISPADKSTSSATRTSRSGTHAASAKSVSDRDLREAKSASRLKGSGGGAAHMSHVRAGKASRGNENSAAKARGKLQREAAAAQQKATALEVQTGLWNQRRAFMESSKTKLVSAHQGIFKVDVQRLIYLPRESEIERARSKDKMLGLSSYQVARARVAVYYHYMAYPGPSQCAAVALNVAHSAFIALIIPIFFSLFILMHFLFCDASCRCGTCNARFEVWRHITMS
jgi:hypothetical protein